MYLKKYVYKSDLRDKNEEIRNQDISGTDCGF